MTVVEELAERVGRLTLGEAAELAALLRTRWGVEAPGVPARESAELEAPVAAADDWAVYLVGCGEKKIEVLKLVRELRPLTLKEAKDFVDRASGEAPQCVRDHLSRAEAEGLLARLLAVGAASEVR